MNSLPLWQALRRQMGSKKTFEGDPVVLVVTPSAVRVVNECCE
jgi:hypothetical protein